MSSAVAGALVDRLEVVSVALAASVEERLASPSLGAEEIPRHGTSARPDVSGQRANFLCGAHGLYRSVSSFNDSGTLMSIFGAKLHWDSMLIVIPM